MAFPSLKPTGRNFNPGDYPIKTFRSQSGSETRILYGSQRTNMSLELNYDNITDTNAGLFLTHFDEVQGTFQTFTVPSTVRSGWSGSSTALDVSGANAWRYAEAPQITAVRPGVSSVRVKLIGVL
jgi:hypothetical protein